MAISNSHAATTVGANITSAGTLAVATSTLTGNLTVQDANSAINFYVDNNNHRVGVATTTPAFALTVGGDINMDGKYALYQNSLPVLVASSTNYSLSVGTEAGKNLTNGGTQNTFLGYQAGYTNTTADYNTAVGYQALYSNTTGSSNTALGDYALFFNTTGSNNVGIGHLAFLGGSNAGSNNIAIGTSAGVRGGSWNIDIGSFTQNSLSDAFANVAIGYQSGGEGSYSSSTIVGYRALYSSSVTGDGNIALGYQAADNISSGSNNIVIGYDIDAPSATGSYRMSIANILFGDGLNGTGTTISGRLGVASSTPWRSTKWDYGFGIATSTVITATTTIGASNTLVANINENRVGIGTAAPKAVLEVNGGMRLNTTTAKPTCDVTQRGTFYVVQGGAGVQDTVEVCAKAADDSYAWRTIY